MGNRNLEKIIKALSSPKTRRQLMEMTNLSDRTLRYDLNVLRKRGLLREIHPFKDLRRKFFSLK